MYSWCKKIISFTPIKDKNYEAVYDYVELSDGVETCGVKLFEIVQGKQKEEYSKVEVNDYQVIEKYCE